MTLCQQLGRHADGDARLLRVLLVEVATMALSAQDMVALLDGVPPGTEVFISYLAGRKPTDRAIREAEKASDEGYNKRWLQGRVERVWTTKKQEPVLTVFAYTRYNEDDKSSEGHYRTINPALGKLLSLEVVR